MNRADFTAAQNARLWLVGRVDASTGRALHTLRVLTDEKPYRAGEIVRPVIGDPWRCTFCRSAMLECIMEAPQQCHDAQARANADGVPFTRIDVSGGVLLVFTADGVRHPSSLRDLVWSD